jgi:hypothetical protein
LRVNRPDTMRPHKTDAATRAQATRPLARAMCHHS